ncbi:MAG: hypothetical protein GY714_28460 [Desulfobacterales bacterium]|nr:hypothetical protein [Desulfobacterales bacterium]
MLQLNKRYKLVQLLLFLIITSIFSGCGMLAKDYYSIPENNNSKSGFIMKGSGRGGWKYGYSINNVFQIKKKDLIIEARIDNHYKSMWAIGPYVFSIIPTFGLIKGGYRGELLNGKEGVTVSVAIFAREPDKLSINLCKVGLSKEKGNSTYPLRYKYSFLGKDRECDCKKGEYYKKDNLNDLDILLIELIYDQLVFPDKKIEIILPDFQYKKETIKIPKIKYIPGSGFEWTVVL